MPQHTARKRAKAKLKRSNVRPRELGRSRRLGEDAKQTPVRKPKKRK